MLHRHAPEITKKEITFQTAPAVQAELKFKRHEILLSGTFASEFSQDTFKFALRKNGKASIEYTEKIMMGGLAEPGEYKVEFKNGIIKRDFPAFLEIFVNEPSVRKAGVLMLHELTSVIIRDLKTEDAKSLGEKMLTISGLLKKARFFIRDKKGTNTDSVEAELPQI